MLTHPLQPLQFTHPLLLLEVPINSMCLREQSSWAELVHQQGQMLEETISRMTAALQELVRLNRVTSHSRSRSHQGPPDNHQFQRKRWNRPDKRHLRLYKRWPVVVRACFAQLKLCFIWISVLYIGQKSWHVFYVKHICSIDS